MVWVDERLQLREPATAGALSLFLVVDAAAEPLAPVPGKLLAEAIADGTVTVTEVSEGGSVPVLLVHNTGPVDVFALAGDVVSGGKQDRILTEDLVLAPNDKPEPLPVNCVEASRWHAGGRGLAFAHAGRAEPELTREVQMARDQSHTWAKVDELLTRRAHRSPTHAYTHTLGDPVTREQIERAYAELDATLADAKAVGVVAAVGGEIESAEIYETPALFRSARPSLLRSLILGAIGRAEALADPPSVEVASSWLHEARTARERRKTEHRSSSYVETESETTQNFELRSSEGRRLKGSYYRKK